MKHRFIALALAGTFILGTGAAAAFASGGNRNFPGVGPSNGFQQSGTNEQACTKLFGTPFEHHTPTQLQSEILGTCLQ
jgi:hypothetical protein